jgi:ribonuclease G
MSGEILIHAMPGEVRAAILNDGTLGELQIARSDRASLVGNIYLGRVTRIMSGMEAAFVDLGIGRAGFLGLDGARLTDTGDDRRGTHINEIVTEGQALTVQVIKDAIGRKGVQLSRRITLPGRFLVYTPTRPGIAVSRQIGAADEQARLGRVLETLVQPGEGLIARTAALGVDGEAFAADAAMLRALWQAIEAARAQAHPPMVLHSEADALHRILRDSVHDGIDAVRFDNEDAYRSARSFCRQYLVDVAPRLKMHRGPASLFEHFGIDDEIARALAAHLDLPCGGGVVIEQTEALTAIDVNTGGFTDATHPAETALRTNMEAADEVARQLRLRNIGGLIVIDFIRIDEDAMWQRVAARLDAAFAGDRGHPRIVGRTNAGLVEVTRRRRRESLAETLTIPCAACAGRGRVKSPQTVALEILRAVAREAANAPPGDLVVLAAAPVIAYFDGDGTSAWATVTAGLARRIELRAASELGPDRFDIFVG